MKLTAVQRRILLEAQKQDDEQQANAMVKRVQQWANNKIQNMIAPLLIQLMEGGDKNLINWLTQEDTSALNALAQDIGQRLIRSAMETVAGEMGDLGGQSGAEAVGEAKLTEGYLSDFREFASNPAAFIVGRGASAAVQQLFKLVMKKIGETGLFEKLVESTSQYVNEHIRMGNIPDSISAQSKKFASFDIPDAVSSMLGPAGATNIMRVLSVLRKQPELYQSIWRMVQGMKGMGATSASAGTSAQRQTRQTSTGAAVSGG